MFKANDERPWGVTWVIFAVLRLARGDDAFLCRDDGIAFHRRKQLLVIASFRIDADAASRRAEYRCGAERAVLKVQLNVGTPQGGRDSAFLDDEITGALVDTAVDLLPQNSAQCPFQKSFH